MLLLANSNNLSSSSLKDTSTSFKWTGTSSKSEKVGNRKEKQSDSKLACGLVKHKANTDQEVFIVFAVIRHEGKM